MLINSRQSLIIRYTSVALIICLILPACAIGADSFTGKCVSVHDGDTIGVMRDGKEARVRLDGVDCPELHQDFGSGAKQFTSGLVFSKTVTVVVKDHDRYGRIVGRVKIDDKDLSYELVRSGMAWHYKKYSKDKNLANAESEARAQKLGLWSMPNPIPPWEFRKSKTSNDSQTGKIRKDMSGKNSEIIKVDTVDTSHGKRIIYTGTNGGKYYINKKGKKVYIKNDKNLENR